MVSVLNMEEGRRTLRAALRVAGIQKRMALSEKEHMARSVALSCRILASFPMLLSKRVAFCWPIKNEPDLRPLIRSFIAAEPLFVALLPVVIAPNEALCFRQWLPETKMEKDAYGIDFPAEGEYLTPEVMLIPVNAFDDRAYRLGYGGGFFDRTLATLTPKPLAIGLGFECLRVETTYPTPHDIALDAIVTESRVLMPRPLVGLGQPTPPEQR